MTTAFNVVALIAACICLSYTIGIWRMVKAPSRLVLMLMSGWLVAARSVYLVITTLPNDHWVMQNLETVQSLVLFLNLPMWILLAYAFGLTYYELRRFHLNGKSSELAEALQEAEEEA